MRDAARRPHPKISADGILLWERSYRPEFAMKATWVAADRPAVSPVSFTSVPLEQRVGRRFRVTRPLAHQEADTEYTQSL